MRLERLFGPGFRGMHESLASRCRELGLAFQAPEVLSNSRLAVEAAEFARDAGGHDVFHRAVLAAYFSRGLDIGDAEVLGELAEENGLDGAVLAEAIATGRYADRRVAAEDEARRLGVTAVPTFIFAEGVRVIGAQPLEHFRETMRRASSAEHTRD